MQVQLQHLSSCSVIPRISNSIAMPSSHSTRSEEVNEVNATPEMKSKLFIQPDAVASEGFNKPNGGQVPAIWSAWESASV